jgi:hypothetical protein
MEFLKINFQSKLEIQQQLEIAANKLLTEVLLQVNETFYRLVDIEFYVSTVDPEVFCDKFTHEHEQQKRNGRLYVHGSGMDITFGDGINYGGILIRGAVEMRGILEAGNLLPDKSFDGPWSVREQVFSHLEPLTSINAKNEIRLVDLNFDYPNIKLKDPLNIFNTQRVGLPPKPNKEAEEFRTMKLRYVAFLESEYGFKQIVKGISKLVEDANLEDKDLEFKILRYKRKQ